MFVLEDLFCSVDPRVGAIIFKNLFGSESLRKNAAVVLTIDEASLQCFLDSKELSDAGLSVNLKLQLMEKGNLSSTEHYPTSSAAREQLQGAPSTALVPERRRPVKATELLPWEAGEEVSRKPQEDEKQQSFIEQAYSGAVGKKTYW